MRRQRPSDETLVTLRGKLEDLPIRSAERQHLLQGCADLHGRPRRVTQPDMERFCELVAAMKLRTTNQNGRHLSTDRRTPVLSGLPTMGCVAVRGRSASVISLCFAAGTRGLRFSTALA